MIISKHWLQSKDACTEGIDWVVEHCNGQKDIDVVKALMFDNKLNWANWLIVRVMTRPQYLAYAIYAAEQVLPIFEKKYPYDKRPREAINAVKKVLENDTIKNRNAAYAAAAATATDAAAYVAVYAALAAADANAALAATDAAAKAADYAANADAAMKKKILEYGLKLLEDSDE